MSNRRFLRGGAGALVYEYLTPPHVRYVACVVAPRRYRVRPSRVAPARRAVIIGVSLIQSRSHVRVRSSPDPRDVTTSSRPPGRPTTTGCRARSNARRDALPASVTRTAGGKLRYPSLDRDGGAQQYCDFKCACGWRGLCGEGRYRGGGQGRFAERGAGLGADAAAVGTPVRRSGTEAQCERQQRHYVADQPDACPSH